MGAHPGTVGPEELLVELVVNQVGSKEVAVPRAGVHLGDLVQHELVLVLWSTQVELTGVLHLVGGQVGGLVHHTKHVYTLYIQ